MYVFAGVAGYVSILSYMLDLDSEAYIVRLRQVTGIDCPYVYPGLPGDSLPVATGDKR